MKKLLLFFVFVTQYLVLSTQYSLAQGSQTSISCPGGSVSTTLPSNGFSGDDPTSSTGSCGQCCYAGSDLDGDGDQDVTFSVENSKWFKFCNSGSTTLTQTFTVDETANNCNLQGAVFVGSSSSPNNSSTALDIDCSNTEYSEYGSNVGGSADGFSFSDVVIASGQCAYIMVDGYAGATCNDGFTISTSCAVCTAPTSIAESADITICEGSSTTLSATASGGTVAGSVYYSWSPTTGLSPSTGIGSSVTAAPTGTTTYTVTACNDGAGVTCCLTDQVVVTVTPLFIPNAGPDVTSCAPSTVTIGGSPTGPSGSTYSWVETTTNGGIAISGSSTVANPSIAISSGATGSATYTVTVTNGACVRTDAVVVTVGPLVVNAGTDQDVCAGSTAVIGGSPTAPAGSTFSWSETGANAGIAITANSTTGNPTITVDPGATGSATYTVTATLSGCSNTDAVTVTARPLPSTPTATPSASPVCAGSSVTLTASGGAGSGTYSWWTAASGGTQLGTANTLVVTPTATTTYYIQSTDATYGCISARGSVTVNVTLTPVAEAGPAQTVCAGTPITLAGSVTNPGACAPAQTWSIVSGTGTFSNANSLTSTFTPTSTGSITLRLTPCTPGACTAVADNVIMTVSPAPTLTASAVSDTLCPNQITDLSGVATGGTLPPPIIVTNGPFSSTNGSTNIPDNNTSGVVIPISVSGVSNATLGTTDISGVTVNVDHNRIGQVEVWLCPPGVSTASPFTGCVRLIDNRGGNGDDLVNTVFSDAGTTSIEDAANTPPYTGTYNLDGTGVLTSLDGQATNGTWNLVVIDNSNVGATTGTAGTMSIQFSTPTPDPNPYTYSWTTTTGLTCDGGTCDESYATLAASSFTAPTTVTKTLTVTDANGCTDSEVMTVVILAPPTATVESGTTDLCSSASGIGSSSTSVDINFTGIAPWTYTPVEDGVNQAAETTTSDPYAYNITYAEVAALGDKTMIFTVSNLSDKYCNGTVSQTHTVTAFCLLPINLISFNGKHLNRVNQLNWITSTETNNDYFIIEKSNNGIDFSLLEKINSKNGNALVTQEYQALDKTPFNSETYYRLGQVDYNGTYSFLSTILVNTVGTKEISIAPNPIVDYLYINYHTNNSEEQAIKISNIFGKIVYEEKVYAKDGSNELLLDFRNYSDGIYYISMSSSEKNEIIKVFKTTK